jgi:hypothetical protein
MSGLIVRDPVWFVSAFVLSVLHGDGIFRFWRQHVAHLTHTVELLRVSAELRHLQGVCMIVMYTGTSVHERPCSRTIRFTNIFSEQNVSDDERCLGLRTRKLATAASWEYRRGSVNCWLTNLVSVYEHFGSRTASRNELSPWTEVPLYLLTAVGVDTRWQQYNTHLHTNSIQNTVR